MSLHKNYYIEDTNILWTKRDICHSGVNKVIFTDSLYKRNCRDYVPNTIVLGRKILYYFSEIYLQ